MDMRMPEYDGAYAIRRIKEELPGVKILVLTTFDDRETVDAALENGADGYILKEMGDDAVIRVGKSGVHRRAGVRGQRVPLPAGNLIG